MMLGAWGNRDHDDSIRIIHAALDAGIDFIDTADVYSQGESEEIVGAALAGGKRDDVILATKFWGQMGEAPNRAGASRRWIIAEVENSLRRLNTDYIDLYQVHRPTPDTDLDETIGALTDLVRQGKIRYFGHSTYPASLIAEAQWTARDRHLQRPVTEQPPYSILARGIEAEVLPVCAQYGMGVLSWSPLAGGWLTGRYRKGADVEGPVSEARQRLANRYDLSLPENQRKLDAADALAELADEAGVSLIELAIAFVLRHPAITAAISDRARWSSSKANFRRPRSSSPMTRSTASTRSSRPASTSTRPTAAGRAQAWSLRRGGDPRSRAQVMDLPALRYFIAVAEERHFRHAAMRLHISQPPLSARIQGLERELGVRLFHRGPGAPVSLTPAGTALLPLAREVVDVAERAQAAAGRLRRGEVGELSVAAAAGISGRLLADAVRRFRAAYPDIALTLCEMDTGQQLAELEAGRLDVAIIHHVRPLSEASATTLAEAELGIACNDADPLAARDTVDPHDLADGHTILAPGALAPACQQLLLEQCRALGFAPTGRYGVTRPTSFLEALGAVLDRSVVALAPRMTSANRNDSAPLAWRPLDGRPLILRTSALIDPSHDWSAARNFVEMLADGALAAARAA